MYFTKTTNMKKSTLYYYQYCDLNGNLVENAEGSTVTMQLGKKAGWQIKQIALSLTAKYGIKCFCKLIKTETA